MRTLLVLGASFFMVCLSAMAKASGPLSPSEAAASFQLDPGLRVELVAAEPLIESPCALAWDERGRLFVVENRGYPTGHPDGDLLGRIALLEDTNGDGQMDSRATFAENLSYPNGILPWNGGLLVTCAPDLLFLKDTTGDGKADQREAWLTGFDDRNTTQLRVSHPTFGTDGWIYLTSGWTGESSVHSPLFPERPPVRLRTDSRVHPWTLEFQALDGRAQFGQTFDDRGNRFICFNRVHIQHAVLSSRHLRRNKDLAFSQTIQNVPAAMWGDLISGANQNPAARVYPISDNITTADSHAGQFSAACSVFIYRGDALPLEYYGNAFACEPVGNLVHRNRLIPAGATFSAHMADEGREFFASTDNWFRPVFLASGPDGALYVCDMYRKTIEHPQYLPEEVRKRTDFDSGRDMGRIWRITAEQAVQSSSPRKGQTAPEPVLNLADVPTPELVDLLGHPNLWRRETAQRLLLQRQDKEAVPLLVNNLRPISSASHWNDWPRQPEDPQEPVAYLARIGMLNTLAALGKKEWQTELFSRALALTLDQAPAVRITAFRILEQLRPSEEMVPGELRLLWAGDPNPQARFHAALFLGDLKDDLSLPALAAIAREDGQDKWTRAAVLSSLAQSQTIELVKLLLEENESAQAAPEFWFELGRLLGLQTGPLDWKHIGLLPQQKTAPEDWRLSALAGALQTSSGKLRDGQDAAKQMEPVLPLLREWLGHASDLAASPQKPLAMRVAALQYWTRLEKAGAIPRLLELFQPAHSPEIQQEATRALVEFAEKETLLELLSHERWNSLPPGARNALVPLLLNRPESTGLLLGQIESGQLPGHILNRRQRDLLRNHKDPAIRETAGRILQSAGGDRMKAFEEAKAALLLPGDPRNGLEIFKLHCASCHRLDGHGSAAGPDLFNMRNQPKEAILLHTVVPNYEVAPEFAGYEIETRDGRALIGLIASETENHVTLRQAHGIEETIARSDIRALQASALSLMPDELEQSMTAQELADLLAFLKGE
jgi:putative membrane-bound dehydrogenase-like protein